MSGILGNRLNALVGYVYPAISTGVLRRARFRRVHLVSIAAVVFALIVILGSIRRSVSYGTYVKGSFDVSESLGLEGVTKEITANFSQLEYLAFVRGASGSWRYAYGRTYLAGLLLVVPRALWIKNPWEAGQC